MANFLDGLAETVNRGFCVVLGGVAQQAEILQYVLEPGFGQQYNPFPGLYAQNCPLDPPPQPSFGIAGGQCEGVNYRVEVYYTVTPTQPPGAPIPGVTALNSQQVVRSPTLFVSRNQSNNVWSVIFRSRDNADFPVTVFNGNPFNGKAEVTIDNVVIIRQDGQPDTCGNPPGDNEDYQPGDNIYNDNVTYVDNTSSTVNIPVSLVFGYATVNIDGTLNIPINAQFALNPTFNGNFNFNVNTGDLVPSFDNPSAPIVPPGADPGGYSPSGDIPSPPDSIPDSPELPPPTSEPTERQRLLTGCIVTTQVLDGNETILFQEENPDIYIPSLGYVQFLIKVRGASAWTNDIPVKCLRTFIPCPFEGGAIDVKGTPRYGNEFEVTPVYVYRTFNPTYPPPS